MKIILSILIAAISFGAIAQTNPPLSIKGSLDIKYLSRQQPGVRGVKDVYSLNVNVANSALFYGSISDMPQIIEGAIFKSIVQTRSLSYDVNLDVINPRNPANTRNVGRMFGSVAIDSDGSYRYDSGSLVMDILPIGSAGGFSSKFTGLAIGKPLGRPPNFLDNLKCQTVSITRNLNGRSTTIALKKYDKMEFRQCVIGAGPVAIYQPVTVNGEMLYDYDKSCWFFNNMTMQYADQGMVRIDRIGGTIRWVESRNRKQNGEGEYQFDVRVNEPPPSANAAFETKASDESAFFETDSSIPSLTGTMKYKDTIRNDSTISSSVAIDLASAHLTKQQVMALGKNIVLLSIVPLNAD